MKDIKYVSFLFSLLENVMFDLCSNGPVYTWEPNINIVLFEQIKNTISIQFKLWFWCHHIFRIILFCFLFENLDGNFHPHFNVSQTTHVGRMQLVEIMSIYASLDPKLVRLTRILWSVNCWFHYFTIFEK